MSGMGQSSLIILKFDSKGDPSHIGFWGRMIDALRKLPSNTVGQSTNDANVVLQAVRRNEQVELPNIPEDQTTTRWECTGNAEWKPTGWCFTSSGSISWSFTRIRSGSQSRLSTDRAEQVPTGEESSGAHGNHRSHQTTQTGKTRKEPVEEHRGKRVFGCPCPKRFKRRHEKPKPRRFKEYYY